MLSSRYGILAEAINIAFTSLKQRQSISLDSFLQCLHFRSSRPELFCKKGVVKDFAKLTRCFLWHKYFLQILQNFKEYLFFTEYFQWLPLAFAPVEISYSNTVCNKSAAEAQVCLVSFCSREWLIFACIFLRMIFFFIEI